MSWRSFLSTSIGAKVAMAVTGLLLILFLLGHLIGNCLILVGRDAFNSYAEKLQSMGPLLWVVRLGLLAVFGLHVLTGIRLVLANRAARPLPYAREATVVASHASRTMILSGLIVLVFLVIHLLHYTLGAIRPGDFALTEELVRGGTAVTRHDAYGMVLGGFSDDKIVALYVIGMALIGLHLSHGLQSLFQTLGLRHRGYTPWVERIGCVVGWLLPVGFLFIVFAVRLGWVS